MQTSSNCIKQRVSGLRLVLVMAAGFAGLAAGAAAVSLAVGGRAGTEADAPGILAAACLAGFGLIAMWLSLGTLLTAGSVACGRRRSDPGALGAAIAPAALRRVVIVALGVGLSSGAFHPALAAPAAGVGTTISAAPSASDRPDGGAPAPRAGWVPGPIPKTATDATLVLGKPRVTAGADGVVVRAGDSLWSIAAAHLGPEAAPEEIADAWPAWYAANRALIGANPDHIEPGQHLRAPETSR